MFGSVSSWRRQMAAVWGCGVVVLFLSLPLAGCKTSQALDMPETPSVGDAGKNQPRISPRVSWKLYTPFFDQGAHLKKLVDEGQFDTAAKLYSEQQKYFTQNEGENRAYLKMLADHLNRPWAAKLSQAIKKVEGTKWPTQVEQWPTVSRSLEDAGKILTSYPSTGLVANPRYRSGDIGRLQSAIAGLKGRINDSAPSEFASFDHFGKDTFFDLYPLPLPKVPFLRANIASIKGRLEAASTRELEQFAVSYSADELGQDQWRRLGDLYVAAHMKESGDSKKPDLNAFLAAIASAKKAGFDPKNVAGLKIGFIEVTSHTLLKQNQIEFPAQIKVDLPVEIVKADIDTALTNPTAKSTDYLIVFDVALARTRRRVTKTVGKASKILVNYRTRPNKEYNIVQNEVNIAQTNVQTTSINSASAGSRYCYGLGCLGNLISQITAGAAEGKAKKKLGAEMKKLRDTPMTIEVPVYADYAYQVATVKDEKMMSVHYYVIDRKKNIYFKSTFDVVEKRQFEVGYNISNKDPNKDKYLSMFNSEEDVSDWEKRPSSVKLSQLINDYLKHAEEAKPLPGIIALRKEMLRDKNTALAKYEANRFGYAKHNDPRFESVVVVYVSAKRFSGTGFYIMPDIVLTNWHVVKENKFVEMKTFDKRETFGKVIAKDVRLDLALIKVQNRGKPVQFYTGRTVDLGATVEAIGNPEGMEFSITRGVISSVRRHANVNIGSGKKIPGDKGVLFIQTDAPINHGNSGGPLFLGDKVIGVNTWGISKQIAEGLNFSVHYSEVLRFIKEYLPEYKTNTDG